MPDRFNPFPSLKTANRAAVLSKCFIITDRNDAPAPRWHPEPKLCLLFWSSSPMCEFLSLHLWPRGCHHHSPLILSQLQVARPERRGFLSSGEERPLWTLPVSQRQEVGPVPTAGCQGSGTRKNARQDEHEGHPRSRNPHCQDNPKSSLWLGNSEAKQN